MMRIHPYIRLVILFGVMLFGLVGCFRDASDGEGDSTAVPVSNFLDLASATPSPRPAVPTLTATPPREPTETLAPGGPPVNNETDAPDTETPAETPTEDATEPLADRLPTINVPTFTPVGSRFGDSGITPTANLPTQPIPDALITPTALATEVDECTYIVQANDTLFSIASQLETEVDAMVAANPALAANPDALSIGQPLAVPNCEDDTEATAASTAEATSEARAAQTEDPESEDGDDDVRTEDDAPAAPDGQQVHVVQQGENLFRIALQYNVSVDAIVVANPSLSSQATIIQPGQELIIPAP